MCIRDRFEDGARFVRGDGVHAATEGDELYKFHVRLRSDKGRGAIEAGMVRPLVEHMHGGCFGEVVHAVLAGHHKAQGRGKLVNAMANLRVDVVGAAGQHHHTLAVLARPGKRPFAFRAHRSLSLIHI